VAQVDGEFGRAPLLQLALLQGVPTSIPPKEENIMIGAVWRTPRKSKEDDGLFDKFKNTPGIVASYQLVDDDEVVVVTIWESAARRDEYMKTALRSEIVGAHPGNSFKVYELLNSRA
jgi:hypothetical protein